MISLIRDNCDFLQQGIELLERHTSDSYTKSDKATFGSSIGAHMRHVLDHYNAVLLGLDSGVVDYDDRVRETRVELELPVAIEAARKAVRDLQEKRFDLNCQVKVIVSANTRTDDHGSQSTLGRELQFLASHTVHHYALIAVASRMQGILPPDTFGIAPSTLKYLQAADC